MASNLNLATAIVNAQAQVIADALANGYLRLYNGPQPADADTPPSGETLLAELRFQNPAELSVTDGLILFDAIAEVNVLASAQAQYFRALRADGTTVVLDGTVGVAGSDINLNSVELSAGASVEIATLTYTVPK